MNKHRYRIIFNRARRMLMVVSDLARCHGADTARGPGGIASCTAVLRPLTVALWLAGGLVSAAQAGTITADRGAPGGQRPTVLQTGNGLPQINIQTPNSQGLSHNKYSQFDVGERGAILNNGQHNTQTQLAGQVAGNPWLAKGSANIILNEVNSMNPSQLRGFVEVAGKKADVIIANPAGITCSGCGFINAGNNTLAAGRVQLKNGQVAGYDIDRGRISIRGGGMDGSRQDYTHLIARAVEVNARLQAGDLKVTTGRNQTDAEGNVIQVKADDPQGRPQFAVDTSALGGMYGRRITLVGTERGVGVRNAGEIGATQGGFTLNAQGKISNSGTLYAQQNLALKTAQLDNQGQISSGGSLNITSQGDITSKGTLSANGNLQLDSSGRLHAQTGSTLVAGGNANVTARSIEADTGSAMGAGIDDSGKATRRGQLAVKAEERLASHGTHLSHDGFLASGREVDLSGSQSRAATVVVTAREGDINADDSLIDARQATLNTAHAITTRRGAIAADLLNINAAEKIDNAGGMLLSRGEQGLTLNSRWIDNSGGTLASVGDFSLSSHSLNNTAGELGSENGSVVIQSGDISGAQGKILAARDLTLSGQQILLDGGLTQGQQIGVHGTSLSMLNGQLFQTGKGEMQIQVTGNLHARGGAIESAGAIDLRAGSLDNSRGRIASNGKLQVATGQLDNASGTLMGEHLDVRALTNLAGNLLAGTSLELHAGSIDNQHGVIAATNGDSSLKAEGQIDNEGGDIESGQRLTLDAGSVKNSQGQLLAGDAMQIATRKLDNAGGLIQASDALDINTHGGALINADTLTETGGIRAGGALTLSAGNVDNHNGLLSGDTFTGQGLAWNNLAGEIDSLQALNLSGTTLGNGLGLISAGDGDLTASLTQDINNQQGTMQSSRGLHVTASALNNESGSLLAAGGSASVKVQNALTNRQGKLLAKDDLLLKADSIDNANGQLASTSGLLTLSAGTLNNQLGSLAAQKDVQLDAQSLDNREGTITSVDGVLNARLDAAINNQHGVLQSGNSVALTGASLDNRSGKVLAVAEKNQITVRNELNNAQGQIVSGGATELHAASLGNQEGAVSSKNGALEVMVSGAIDNQRGSLEAAGPVQISSTSLDNREASILSANESLMVSTAQSLNNQQGRIAARKNVTLSADGLNNQQGTVTAVDETLTVHGGQYLDNSDGALQSSGDLSLDTLSLTNARGTLQSTQGDGLLTIAGSVNNPLGSIVASGALTLSSGDIDNRKGVLLADSLDLSSQRLNNQAGLIQGSDDLRIDTHGQQVNNSDTNGEKTGIRSGGTLNLIAGDAINQVGLIAGKRLDLKLQSLNNRAGSIGSAEGSRIASGALDNQNGAIQSGGDLSLDTHGADLHNQQGLIEAGQSLNLSASQIDNQHTRGSKQGIEAQDLTLSAGSLNNQDGALRAGDALQASVREQLNNQTGLISSQNSLTVGQPGLQLALNNAGGDIVANGDASLWLGQFDGGGRIVSGGSLGLDINSAVNQSGTLAAGDDLTFNTHGNALANSGALSAGKQLTLTTGQLNNQQSGDINAGTTHIMASGILNQGLIDGGDVLLRTDTLHNTGTGRLYGDRLAIDARALLNDQSGETAATIAARDHLAIATDRLSNQDHGLIYSNGGLSIGAKLDDAGKLTGQASQVENLSATIEAMGDLRIGAAKMENRDIHLTVSPDLKTISVTPNVLDVELCTGERWTEGCGRTDGQHYSFKGSLVEFNKDENSPVAFDFDQDGRSYALDEQGNRITVDVDGKPQYIYLWQDSDKDIIRYNLPGVSDDGRRFDIFSYTQSVKEQQVSGQDSAVIRSGGDLALNGDLHNKDSQVVAGQDLLINGSVDNDETTVRQEITKDGVVVRVGKRKSHEQTHFEGQGDYQAPVQETDLPLHLTVQQQGQGAGEGRTIAQQQSTSGAGGQASGLNGTEALAQLGQQALVSEVPLPSDPPGNMQLKPVSDALSEGSGATDLQRQKTAGGMTNASLNTGSAHDGTQNDGEHSGPPVVVPPQDNWVLRSVTGPVKLPNNSLFSLHPGSDSHYLVETDRRFTDGKQALSSGDFYSQDQLQKRLGDGYYEQSLVRDQVMKATGQRYLSGFSDDESQYRALLSSGKSFTERFTISPGADLSAEQMAQVTSDMVLMVNQTVTLPDGSTQVVSVPKLYARVLPGDLQGNGTLLAGNTVRINSTDKVMNSGSINGRGLTAISAGSLLNTGDISGNSTQLLATGDIVNRGGQLKGGDQLTLQAGNDILSLTGSEQRGSESWLGRQAGIGVMNDGGILSLNAGHDIQLTASAVSNQGVHSATRLIAGNDITLDTAKTAHATDYTRNSHNYDRTQESREVGSTISAGGSLLMQSGHDMNLRAADATATGDATLLAGNNLNLMSGEEIWDQSSRAKWTKHHFLSKTTHKIQSEAHQQNALSSTVSGDRLKVMAGNDLTASGSNILGTHDVNLSAGRNLTLGTAAESDHFASVEQKKKSGFSGTGGIGFSLGHSSQKLTRDDSSNVQKGSVAGSSAGSLTLQAGNAATVHGSDLVAGQDLTVQGKNVGISAAENSHTALTKSVSKSSGLTLGLSGTVGSALNTAVHQVKVAKKEESGRLAALKGTQAALTGYQAAQAAQLAAGATGGSSDGNIAGLTLSYGKQKSVSEQRQEEHSASGSRLQAGRDMHIAATAGDLNVEVAQLKAGQDMALSASRDISLTSGKNSTQSSGHSSSHGGSVGAGLSLGGGAAGLSVSASANQSRGHENGSSLTHTETTADAGRTLTLNSGHDALLQGAQVSGESVKADIGHNLLIASEQDSDHYDMKQTGSNVGGSIIGGAGIGGSASLSGSRDKMNSDFGSVKEQSGLFAGKGGFDITVGNHTQLDGGVIASTAEKEKNRLDTGTLGWSDIHNKADYDVSHQGAGISSGGSVGEQFVGNLANNTLVGANDSGHDSSITHAAVEKGTVTIRDKDKQQQDVATLDRDTEHAANGLSPIFDKEKEQNRLQEAQVIGEIGSQVGDIARTQGEIAATKAGKAELAAKGIREPGPNAAKDETAAYNQALKETSGYKTAWQQWGTGSAIQQGIQAATAAIQGLAGHDLKAAIAGGAAPYIAEIIKQYAPDEASRVIAHAAVAGVIAAAQGNSAGAGAAGAATTALTGETIKKMLYGDVPVSQLSEEQKHTLVTLGSLAAGLAGGLSSGSTSGGMAGAQAGQNELSNNMTGMGLLSQILAQETLNSAAIAEAGKGGANEQAALALTKKVKKGLDAACLASSSCVLMAIAAVQTQQHNDGAGGWTETLPVHEDTTGSTLVTPVPEENKGTVLVTPDQSGEQGATHTGNTDDRPDTGSGIVATPIPNGPSKDDSVYLSEGRDNRLPISEPTIASNGLKIESNSKHTPGAQGFRPNAGIEPRNSLELFGSSVSIDGDKARYSIGADGSIHRFFPDNTGSYHWSGSTGDSRNAMKLDNKIKAQLRKQEGWKVK